MPPEYLTRKSADDLRRRIVKLREEEKRLAGFIGENWGRECGSEAIPEHNATCWSLTEHLAALALAEGIDREPPLH